MLISKHLRSVANGIDLEYKDVGLKFLVSLTKLITPQYPKMVSNSSMVANHGLSVLRLSRSETTFNISYRLTSWEVIKMTIY